MRGSIVGSLALLLSVGGSAIGEDLKKSGTVRIEQVQIAFIGSGNLGGGTLKFGGKSYNFTVGGLGIGGFGVSKMVATGNVYNLKDAAHFPGSYVQGRYGMAIGDASTGKLWLKNSHGVVHRAGGRAHGPGALPRRRCRLHRFRLSRGGSNA